MKSPRLFANVTVTLLNQPQSRMLEEGQRVIVEVAQGQKGPEVRALKLA